MTRTVLGVFAATLLVLGLGGCAAKWHCFEVSWDDGDHNSECVVEADKCRSDLDKMKGYSPEGKYLDCAPLERVFCYDARSGRPLCFVSMADCLKSRKTIDGGECSLRPGE
jgi:hypothetical protein